ncbi:phosphatidylinositol glycan, class W [Cladophialophora psammophila CBS 110553]|uniref:GPI-anchored wall transfer protein n=1 Tax=Cladophialophora psammophila CBS 110553 TaxID=1182543 RepID=W9WKC6_9EURO|nr:phosphatidylinositol glycan, class W [Cladophialophora psammophila CBS 110553]EXJ68348.1 phosphatidylinositol glycan, class W [Cladophialophora psammophila CBS 110553]
MAAASAASYKARKEAFVSNLYGSSLTEINVVTLVAAAAVFLWTALQRRHSFFTPYTPVALLADFLLNVCAILFAITLYSSTPLVLSIFLITPGAVLTFLKTGRQSTTSASDAPAKVNPRSVNGAAASTSNAPPILPIRPFLTHYRGSMLIVTCLAILAVDFPIFPRRYAKVEIWGTSLMDLGVGSFVFSAGVVSARAVVRARTGVQALPSPNTKFVSRFIQALRHSVPLFILGFIRLYSVKGLDYAEHVTEYGVHWNFFFTLALLPPFVEISDSVTRRMFKSYETFALTLAVVYELILNNTDLLSYILISPRGPDLLSKNREGVFSFAGYLAIFLAGRGTGMLAVQFNEPVPKISKQSSPRELTRRERRSVLNGLLIKSLIYVFLYWLTTSLYTFNLTVSRRLANLPYMLWVVAFNNAQMFLFGLVEDCGPSFSYQAEDKDRVRSATSRILAVFNKNGLVIFLVANLLTGLVNLSFNTLDMRPLSAMGLLMGYAVLVTGVALGLDKSGVKIKL